MKTRLITCYWYSGVYSIYNSTKNKYYIGSSSNIESRIKHHKIALKKGTHTNIEMQNDYNKMHSFEVIVLYCEAVLKNKCNNRQKLYQIEKECIKKYDSINNGYNKHLPYSNLEFSYDTKI